MSPYPSSLFERTSRWFDRARASLPDDLPCRKGCSRCCVGLFPITKLDQAELRRGLLALPAEQQEAFQLTAARQVEMIAAVAPQCADDPFIDALADDEIDHLVERFGDLPCPVLLPDGSCGLYDHRPLTCRSMGIPPETNGLVQGACEIQTFVPLRKLSQALRDQEEALARAEAEQLTALTDPPGAGGEELFLPFALLAENSEDRPRQ